MSKDLFLSTFKNFITQYHNVVIVSHVNPDGDAVGSSLAFSYFLQKFGMFPQSARPNRWQLGVGVALVIGLNLTPHGTS